MCFVVCSFHYTSWEQSVHVIETRLETDIFNAHSYLICLDAEATCTSTQTPFSTLPNIQSTGNTLSLVKRPAQQSTSFLCGDPQHSLHQATSQPQHQPIFGTQM